MKLSLVVNMDNRPQNHTFTGSNLGGCVDEDFLVDGLINKIKFFEGFEKEVIVHLDRHTNLPRGTFEKLQELCDTLLIRRHTHENSFNDWNYIRALSMASGDVIIHVDQDTAMFSKEDLGAKHLTLLLNEVKCDFVSYPSHWSPLPVHDLSFDHTWVSTRFFACKRENLDLPEITKCLNDYEYWLKTYPVKRACHWLEHLIGSIAKYRKQTIYYPSINLDNYAIFSWGSYQTGTLGMLNNMPYEEVKKWIEARGIHYPVDVHV